MFLWRAIRIKVFPTIVVIPRICRSPKGRLRDFLPLGLIFRSSMCYRQRLEFAYHFLLRISNMPLVVTSYISYSHKQRWHLTYFIKQAYYFITSVMCSMTVGLKAYQNMPWGAWRKSDVLFVAIVFFFRQLTDFCTSVEWNIGGISRASIYTLSTIFITFWLSVVEWLGNCFSAIRFLTAMKIMFGLFAKEIQRINHIVLLGKQEIFQCRHLTSTSFPFTS